VGRLVVCCLLSQPLRVTTSAGRQPPRQ